MSSSPRVVIVSRPTELQMLIEKHGTKSQVNFFLKTRNMEEHLAVLSGRQERFEEALHVTMQAVPSSWRLSRVNRSDLDRFLFEPDDIVVIVGQDGLVANVSKYLQGQQVIGLNPDFEQYKAVLVRHAASELVGLLPKVMNRELAVEARSMVEARLERQSIIALNEIFIGHRSHQSSRYRLNYQGTEVQQSSSGIIISSGTGATGWASSLHKQHQSELSLPQPTDPNLVFFVREPWPSALTDAKLSEGIIKQQQKLTVTSSLSEGGVIFGDGIEQDFLNFSWGQQVEISLSKTQLNLI